jgi:hypothetical protein
MADYTVNAPRLHRAPSARGWEFRFYFAMVFALALLVGVLTWSWRVLTTGQLPRLGPVGRAVSDARAITPMLFRA